MGDVIVNGTRALDIRCTHCHACAGHYCAELGEGSNGSRFCQDRMNAAVKISRDENARARAELKGKR